MPSGKRSKADMCGFMTSRNRWAPVRKASRGPFVSRLGGGFGSLPLRRMSGLQQLTFKTLPRLAALESRHDFDLSAVQISGLPGNDRPFTHTVTLRVARSLVLARWRHSISSPRLIQRTPYPRQLLATSSGANSCNSREPRSLTLRQVQHSKYRARSRSVPVRMRSR